MGAMMAGVPRPRPPYLHREVTRHGRVIWYVHKRPAGKVRIRADYGTPEFMAEYRAALGTTAMMPKIPEDETLSWLVHRFYDSVAWQKLAPATQRKRRNMFRELLKTAGDMPFAGLAAADVEAGRDRRAKTPAQARHFLDALRSLYRWAKEAKLVATDPTVGIQNLPLAESDGFRPWTEDDVSAYEKRWPIGTRQRVWLDVLLYTGLRRGDAVRFGRQHVRNGVGTIKTEKTGMEVNLPILPVLERTLTAGPCGQLTFICGEKGIPLNKVSFGNMFGEACREAGVAGSAHGVRKIAAIRAAENGATVAQLEALFGWSGGGMASLYTKSADRRRLARESIGKLIVKRDDDGITDKSSG